MKSTVGVEAILYSMSMVPAVDFPASLSNWIVVEPPAKYSEQWYAANHSKFEWKVWLCEEDGEEVGVELYDTREQYNRELPFPLPQRPDILKNLSLLRCGWNRGRRCFIEVDNGWIVGFNCGEFGGSLWWFSPGGSEYYEITRGNFDDFFGSKGGLLALEGLAHMMSSRGQLLQLSQDEEGIWTASQFVKLPHAPQVALLRDDASLLIATTRELLIIHPDKKIDIFLQDVFWDGLYPNSIVSTASGTIYLGMRHGVARIQQSDTRYKVDWLLPNQDFVNAMPIG